MRLLTMKVVVDPGLVQVGFDKGNLSFGKHCGKLDISGFYRFLGKLFNQVNITIFAPEKTFPEFRPA
jgi:hypothetical protein